AAATQTSDSFDQWESPLEGQLPAPISQALFDAPDTGFPLYPDSLAVYSQPTDQTSLLPLANLEVRPQCGQFHVKKDVPPALYVTYHYGFSSPIGAGPYDRRIATPSTSALKPRGSNLGSFPRNGTVIFVDSLTYSPVDDLAVQGELT